MGLSNFRMSIINLFILFQKCLNIQIPGKYNNLFLTESKVKGIGYTFKGGNTIKIVLHPF